jgi:hypothetical protein
LLTVMLIPFLCSSACLVLTSMPSLCRVASPQPFSKHHRPPLFFLSSGCSAAQSSGGGSTGMLSDCVRSVVGACTQPCLREYLVCMP